MASNKSRNSLKTFLDTIRNFVTKYGPMPTHGAPIYTKNTHKIHTQKHKIHTNTHQIAKIHTNTNKK